MKSYIVLAYKFMKALLACANDRTDDGIIAAIGSASWRTHIYANYTCGSARHVIMTKNFVIKWDMTKGGAYTIGGCEDELRMYEHAKRCGYDYLLAKITPIYLEGRYFYVMPTVENIGPEYHDYNDIEDYLTDEEYWWIRDNIQDLHGYNWGLDENDMPVIIDYAFRRQERIFLLSRCKSKGTYILINIYAIKRKALTRFPPAHGQGH